MKKPKYPVQSQLKQFLLERKSIVETRIKMVTKFIGYLDTQPIINEDDYNQRLGILKSHKDEIEHIDKWIVKVNEGL